MNKKSEDCYYFYNSTCNRGDDCEYRHCVEALKSNVICKYWKKRRDCNRTNCRFRHSFESSRDRKNTPCYHEARDGCMKIHCPYLHKKSNEPLMRAIKLGSNRVILPVKNGSLLGNWSQASPIPLASHQNQRRRTLSQPSYPEFDREYETSSESSEDESNDSSRKLRNEEEGQLIQQLKRDACLSTISKQRKADSQRTEISAEAGRSAKQNKEVKSTPSEKHVNRKKQNKELKSAVQSTSACSPGLVKTTTEVREEPICLPSTSYQSCINNTNKQSQNSSKLKPNQQGAYIVSEGKHAKKKNKPRSKSCLKFVRETDGLPSLANPTNDVSVLLPVQPLSSSLQSQAVGTSIHNFIAVSKEYEENMAALNRYGMDDSSPNPKDKSQDEKKKSRRTRRSSANPK